MDYVHLIGHVHTVGVGLGSGIVNGLDCNLLGTAPTCKEDRIRRNRYEDIIIFKGTEWDGIYIHTLNG